MVSIQTPFPAFPRAEKEGSPSQRTLLQFEDNAANAALVSELIARRSDLKLLTALNGHLGIEMALDFQPDLILMDMRMPGMSGLAAIVILRGNPATAHIPVIALSSSAFSDDIKTCLEAGVFRYMTKPFKIENLMAVIDSALQYAAESCPKPCSQVLPGEAVPSCGGLGPRAMPASMQ